MSQKVMTEIVRKVPPNNIFQENYWQKTTIWVLGMVKVYIKANEKDHFCQILIIVGKLLKVLRNNAYFFYIILSNGTLLYLKKNMEYLRLKKI